MESDILSQAKKLFALAQKADLLKKESFIDVFPGKKIEKITHNLNENRDLSQAFIDYLQEKGRAFMLNHDPPVEDIIFGFRSVFPSLDISYLGEERVGGDWFQGMKIGENIYKYKMSDQYVSGDVLYDIGRKLFSLSKGIICANFGDNNQYLVVDLDYVTDFVEFGFFAI